MSTDIGVTNFQNSSVFLAHPIADDDDDEIAYFTVRWKTEKLV